MNRRFDDIMTGGDRTERIVVVTLENENQLPMQQHGRQQKNNGKLKINIVLSALSTHDRCGLSCMTYYM